MACTLFPVPIKLFKKSLAETLVNGLCIDLHNSNIVEADLKIRKLLQSKSTEQQLLGHYYKSLYSLKTGKPQDALDSLLVVVNHFPQHPTLLLCLANLHATLGQLEKAVGVAMEAHKREPKNADILYFIGKQWMKLNEFGKAYKALLVARQVCAGEYAYLLDAKRAACLAQLRFHRASEPVEKDLIKLLERSQIELASLDKPAFSILKCRYNMRESNHSDTLTRLATDRLFIALISRVINTELELEKWLCGLRRGLLHEASQRALSKDEMNLALAFGLQNFMNEYVHPISASEQALLSTLSPVCNHDLSVFCVLSMYRRHTVVPDDPYWEALGLSSRYAREVVDSLKTEQKLKCNFDSVGFSDSQIEAVQNQYEQNPYPRWVGVPAHPRPFIPFEKYIERLFPQISTQHWQGKSSLQVLIAGCGTGRQVASFALTFPATTITAIDISRSSLSYAKRRIDELDISNVEFVHMSLLDVGKLAKNFDVIECGGVLHHLPDPLAGFRALNEVLAPGGVMKISVYSKLGRKFINTVRDIQKTDALPETHEAVRNARYALIISESWPALQKIAKFRSFYTVSGTRDLLYHSLEHQMDIPWISTSLEVLNKQFLGFQFRTADPIKRFKASFPDPGSELDLDKWKKFEEHHPDTFLRMYTFWCQ